MNRSLSTEQIAATLGQETLARLQRLEEMQLATLEAHGREAKDRADFKRWWMKEQRRQLRAAAATAQLRNQHWQSSNSKGKSVPGKNLAKSTQPTDKAEESQLTAAPTEQMDATESTEGSQARDQVSTEVELPGPSTFQRLLRTVTRSKQSLTQVDGNASDDEDEISHYGDPTYKPSDDDDNESTTDESDFVTDDSCTEDESDQNSFRVLKRDQETNAIKF